MPSPVRPRLRLDTAPEAAEVPLAPAARAVADEVASGAGPHLLVLGAPGSGRTTLAVRTVVEAARAGRRVALLSPSRRVAGRLRDEVARRAGAHDDAVQVVTPTSFAFALLRQHAAYWGGAEPALLSGPDEDGILAELLEGHASGEVRGPGWSDSVPQEALALDAFRHELRDILARAGELALEPEDLRLLAARHDRPAWSAVAAVLEEYRETLGHQDDPDDAPTLGGRGAERRFRRYDSARLVDEAALVLASWHLPPIGVRASATDVPQTPRWDLVVVDDYQDATRSTARLLRVLVRDGARLVLLGDPDVAVQTFRGGSPSLVREATAGYADGGFGAEVRLLPEVHRGTPALRSAVARLAERLPAGGPGVARRRSHVAGADRDAAGAARGRRPVAAAGGVAADDAPAFGPPVEVLTLGSAAIEADAIADAVRHAHLVDAVPYARCAVIVRTSGQASAIRSLLGARRVPVSPGRLGALRDEPAVRPLLAAVRAAAEGPTGAALRDLMLSPVGGADPVTLRRLMRTLRAASEARGGAIDSDTVLLEATRAVETGGVAALPGSMPAPLTDPLERVARVIVRTREALAGGAGPTPMLWAAWDASGLAEPWQSRAIEGGAGAAQAHADLDAVLALFYAAERYELRGAGAGALGFVDRIESRKVAEDTLAAQSGRRDLVEVLTPAQAAGQEWDLVVVAGLQEDVWPDLRRRDTILGSQALVDVVTGRGDGADRWTEARKEVRDDELRQLVLAASRATTRLLVTAVDGPDSGPSLFHELLAKDAAGPGEEGHDHGGADAVEDAAAGRPGEAGGSGGSTSAAPGRTTAGQAGRSSSGAVPGSGPRPADREQLVARDLRELVARLRHRLTADPGDADAARVLARLRAEGVAGADPRGWALAHEPTTDAPLRSGDEPVTVSPSAIESVTTCGLRWALTRFGGRGADSGSQALGTLVHEIAEQHPHGTHDELRAALDARMDELELGEGLAADQERAKAERLIEKLAQYTATDAEVRTEVDVDVVVGDARIKGQIDRLETQSDGRVVVADLKTGNHISQAEADQHAQLGAYQVALLEQHRRGEGPEPAGARLVYLGTSNVTVAKREQEALGAPEGTWAHELIGQAVTEMSGSAVHVRTNKYCGFCEVRTSCPLQTSGRRVGGDGTTEEST
ncbi:PD-(D/E)XK nuclease family protein [Georgenia sp. Z1344]|uniref:PD-(D/E)XK nuclease family protein n=1 Tax=Georgenia sp. Z1344 TaxID=3416706 RepID=UPI003CF2852B